MTRRFLRQSTHAVLSRGVRLDCEVLCMDGMMTCQVRFVARESSMEWDDTLVAMC